MSYNEALENLPRAWNSFSDREGDVAMSRLHFKLFSTEKLREHFLLCRHPCSWVYIGRTNSTRGVGSPGPHCMTSYSPQSP